LLALTAGVIVCLGTSVIGKHSLWWVAFNAVPGAEVIRAPARIGLLLIIPASLGLANFLNHFQNRRRVLVAVGIAVCLLEQAAFLPSYDKQQARDRISAITAVLPRDAKCFFYVGNNPAEREQAQIDAMWASLQSGVPTINGYSGSTPAGWGMVDDIVPKVDASGHELELRNSTATWAAKWAMNPDEVTWLKQIGPDHVCHIRATNADQNKVATDEDR
jgi:hypothetical protein